MADGPASNDKYLKALDFIINFLKEHELNLDKSIEKLAIVTEQIAEIDSLKVKLDEMEEKLNNMHKEITNLSNQLSKPN